MVRTPGFHPGNRGSIPREVTMKKDHHPVVFFHAHGVSNSDCRTTEVVAIEGSDNQKLSQMLASRKLADYTLVFPVRSPSKVPQLVWGTLLGSFSRERNESSPGFFNTGYLDRFN
jgi:hypothetical protein